MLRNRLFIILGVILAILILSLGAMVMIKNARGSSDPSVGEITWCDKDAGRLCIVSFGTDNTDRMIINFKLPEANFPKFYVKGMNRDVARVYSCERDPINQTSVYCVGVRTPLGEKIDVEVYFTDGDILNARGRFVVSTLLISTPTIDLTPSPTQTKPASPTVTPVNDLTPSPTQTKPGLLYATPKPGTGYPNP